MINLNTGKQEFVLNFDGEHIEKIYFNPCDPALMVRIKDFCDEAGRKISQLDDIELDEHGKPKDESFIGTFGKMLDIVYTGIDKAFGSEISATVFKYCSPFARVSGGEYFFSAFVEAITPEIKHRVEKSTREKAEKMKKHIGKYQK